MPRNEDRLKAFRHEVLHMWWWQLRRRSQRSRWNTTNIYAEIDLEMKARALAKCEITDPDTPKRHWRDDPGLMTFLRAL